MNMCKLYLYIWLFAKSPYRSRLPGGLVRNLVQKTNWRPCTGSTPKDLVRPPCTTTLYATLYACLHLAPNIWPYNFPSRRPQPVANLTAKSADGWSPRGRFYLVRTLYEWHIQTLQQKLSAQPPKKGFTSPNSNLFDGICGPEPDFR